MSSNPSMRMRSPRFPSYPLGDAVEFAARIYKGVHRAPVDTETAFQLMGFKSRSGASSSALGAVRQFGFLEGSGGQTRVSDLALQVLEPQSNEERVDALRRAAREPEVFRSLLDRYGGRIPSADEPIRAYLIRELGFSKTGAEYCLSSLRSTMQYVDGLPGGGQTDSSPAPITSASEFTFEERPRVRTSEVQVDGSSRADFVVQLGGGRTAIIEIKGGRVGPRQLAQLERFIRLQREFLEEEVLAEEDDGSDVI